MSPAKLPPLSDFLSASQRPANTLSYHELQGFLFAVASAPEPIEPSEWVPMVFNEQDPGFASEEEGQHVIDQLREVYEAVNATVLSERPALPADCTVRPAPLDNLEPTAPLSAWSRGFATGHQWLHELWDIEMPEDLDEEVGAVLAALSFFASARIADAIYHDSDTAGLTLEALAQTLLSHFPEAMASYADIGRRVLAEAYRAEDDAENN